MYCGGVPARNLVGLIVVVGGIEPLYFADEGRFDGGIPALSPRHPADVRWVDAEFLRDARVDAAEQRGSP